MITIAGKKSESFDDDDDGEERVENTAGKIENTINRNATTELDWRWRK